MPQTEDAISGQPRVKASQAQALLAPLTQPSAQPCTNVSRTWNLIFFVAHLEQSFNDGRRIYGFSWATRRLISDVWIVSHGLSRWGKKWLAGFSEGVRLGKKRKIEGTTVTVDLIDVVAGNASQCCTPGVICERHVDVEPRHKDRNRSCR